MFTFEENCTELKISKDSHLFYFEFECLDLVIFEGIDFDKKSKFRETSAFVGGFDSFGDKLGLIKFFEFVVLKDDSALYVVAYVEHVTFSNYNWLRLF